jgi:hypothetical protein
MISEARKEKKTSVLNVFIPFAPQSFHKKNSLKETMKLETEEGGKTFGFEVTAEDEVLALREKAGL